ncbi:MAG: urea transporter [Gammaproteobacteria bacterium]|nr:MAG: urea transporter [Gammaproteobacteria bacterium]
MIVGTSTKHHQPIAGLFRAYAAIMFTQSPWIGVVYIMATFLLPNTAISGLIAAGTGYLTAKLFRFPNISSGMYIYNSLLVGLTLGATYQFDPYLAMLIIFGSILAVFVTSVTTDLLWRWERLPVLSVPFVIVALIVSFAASGYSNLSHYLTPYAPAQTIFSTTIDGFFTALGSTLFIPLPIAGIIFFIGILITSRYLALLAISGYIVGKLFFTFFAGVEYSGQADWTGFNFILTAVAIGGIFTIPDWKSFGLAMLGAALAALVTAATQNFLREFGIPVFAIPFLIATFSILAGLRKRITLSAPHLLLEAPDLPERNYEKARLAKVRSGKLGSVPLRAPFFGEWQIYQGFEGTHTHKEQWKYALDFFVVDNGKSYQEDGNKLDDYYCYGLPVICPAHGHVVRVMNGLIDNAPGEVDTKNNWGNFILIRLTSGLHVLLCHLKLNSIKVKEGEAVNPGDIIAACGNSGRSPQPHIHMHVQTEATIGSPTYPFHLVTIINAKDTPEAEAQFHLHTIPDEADTIQPAEKSLKLAKPLHLPVGRRLQYKTLINGIERPDVLALEVELTLVGQFRIKAENGASCAFEEHEGIIAFFDRQGPKDDLFDIWILSIGLTPLSDVATKWYDSPAAAFMPLSLKHKILLNLLHPFGAGLKSNYSRKYDQVKQTWKQIATHKLSISLLKTLELTTEATLCSKDGFKEISGKLEQNQYNLSLLATEQVGDYGIDAWTKITETE